MKSLNDFVNSAKTKQAENDYFDHAESIVDCEDDFVSIYFIHDIFIDKEDETRLLRVGKAVNETNKIFLKIA